MTTITPDSTPKVEDPRDRILGRYEGLSFAPMPRLADRSGNFTRGARKTPKRKFIR